MVIQVAYAALFTASATACIVALSRISQIEAAETRRGLGALLVLSAGWAFAQVGHLVAPPPWDITSYTVGLVFGLATVGAWLYFCSAYTGRSYHRQPLYRRLAVAAYVLIVAFKLTNVWHGLYFETAVVRAPFRHTAIQEQAAFWIIAGLSYVLSAMGFYMLVDAFEQRRSTSPGVAVVVLLAALPVVFDLIGYLTPSPILPLNYESVGVGLFALGALYVVREPFFAPSRFGWPQLVDEFDDAVVILDTDDRVRDYNDAAASLFPELDGREAPSAFAFGIEQPEACDGGTVEFERNGHSRYFVVETSPITVGATEVGRGVVLTDVTEIERQRRRLREKDERLEGLATAITHELRNSIGIVSGQAELLSRTAEEADDPEITSRVERITEEVENLERTAGDLATLAKYSQTISETRSVALDAVVRTAKRRTDADDLTVETDSPVDVVADRDRLEALFRHAFEFAAANGASTVTVRGRDDGFIISGDGDSLDEFEVADVLEYGNSVPDADTEMLLPNVEMLAAVHGWETTVRTDGTDGTEIAIDGVTTTRSDD